MKIAGLNGLRAIAVTGVLLYHGGLHAAPAGFLGVDLFFVISGFLITTLLLREATAGRGRIDVLAFWGRRGRRLLPGLVLVVVATVLVFTLAGQSAAPGGLRGDAAAGLLYVANWHFLNSGDGYFNQFALPSPFQHTWSLAIEEQFYIAWPLLLLVALRLRASRLVLAVATATAALLSAAWMSHLFVRAGADRVYYGTDSRAQAILVGVVTAFLLERVINHKPGHRRTPSRLVRRLADAAGIAALCCLILAMVRWSPASHELYRGGLLCVAIVSGVLIAAVVQSPHGVLTRTLEARPLQAVGVLSYSLYLWHWPVFLFLTSSRTSLSGLALLSVRLVVTFALASAAYLLVEAPLRSADWRLPRAVAVPIGMAGIAGGVALVAAGGLASPVRQPDLSATVAVHQHASGGTVQHSSAPLAVAHQRQAVAAPSEPGPHRLRVTLLGDSTALTLGEGLRDVPGRNGVEFFNAAILGCGVTTASPYRYMGEISPYAHGQCLTWEARWRRRVTSRPADVVAILVGRWEVTDQVVSGTWTHVGTPLFDAYLRTELEKAVEAASVGGAAVALLTAPYYSRGEQPDGSIWPEDDPARVDALNDILREVAAQQPQTIHLVEFGRRISGGNHRYSNEVDGVVLRYDGVHFTPGAAQWIQPWLCQQLSRAARRTNSSLR